MINRAGADIGFVADLEGSGIGVGRQNHFNDRQAIFAGEVKVALVVGRAAEDGARAVVHQHEIGDPHRQGLARFERMLDLEAGIEADLFTGIDIGWETPPLFRLLICAASSGLAAPAA